MRLALFIPIAILLLFACSLRAQVNPGTPSGATAPVSGTPPHVGDARTQVVPTPPTVVQPSVANDPNNNLPATSIPSPATPASWVRQTIPIASCFIPPKIDGNLNDSCWKSATHAAGFYRLAGTTPISEGDQTEAWICADAAHLYVAFRCLDTHPERISGTLIQRNGNYGQDDHVGIDIDSQNNRRSLSTFVVTARGTQNEALEGGTADNITWAGDWKGAAVRNAHGWTAEFSIPFALLRYPKGTTAFGLDLFRKLSRESSYQNWPYLPPDGNNNEPLYIHEFTGIHPPFYAPRPIFLPYTLATAGTGSSGRFGLDIKYPLSTTLTGVATIKPDFETIEQDVTNINFSYTEKLLTDRRPFFAEGSGFLPYRDLFYSRRIGALDGGLKVAGKQGDTSIGFLATDTRGSSAQNAALLAVGQDIGLFSHAAVNFVSDIEPGQPSNQTGKVEGIYGWKVGPDHWSVQADHLPSWVGGRQADSKDYFSFSTSALPGKMSFNVDHTDIGSNFRSNLGYVPDIDEKGSSVSLDQNNFLDTGRFQFYDVTLSANSYQHHTGGFFQNDLNANVYLETRSGLGYNVNYDISRRDVFHDHSLYGQLAWGKRTLYQRGSFGDTTGRQGGEPYNYLSFSQSFLISHPLTLQVNYNRLHLGDTQSSQTIFTGNYLLSSERSVGARIVNQAGTDQGTGLGTDIYFSFGQQVRSGSDLFLLFGDPNSPRTRGKVTLKIIRPF